MIKTGIIGGAGYTAGELIRILIHHPDADIRFIHSTSHHGEPIAHVHSDLYHVELSFSDMDFQDTDLVFFCMGHDKSQPFMENHTLPENIKVIDLSRDFRLKSPGNPFIYGLPELNRHSIKTASFIANPGCFATAIQLALLPLAHENALSDEIHVHGITGSTGAGQNPTPTSHFSWRNNNVSLYKVFQHQHLSEIEQSIKQLQPDYEKDINFVPVRGDFSRGILVSAYTQTQFNEKELNEMFSDYYKDHPFVHVINRNPDIKQVVNTNNCYLHVTKHRNYAFITSVSDNLLKGASGQAVQNMNLMHGLDEKSGLDLKAVSF